MLAGTLCGAQPVRARLVQRPQDWAWSSLRGSPLNHFLRMLRLNCSERNGYKRKPGAPFLMRRTIVSQIVSR